MPYLHVHQPGLVAVIRPLIQHADRMLLRTAVMILICLPATIVLAATDERMLDGTNVWMKPLKFQISLAIFLATLAVMRSLTSAAFRAGQLQRGVRWTAIGVSVFEISWITLQAARGERSHYSETPFGNAMYAAMGIGAVLLSLTPFVLMVAIARNRSKCTGQTLLRWGVYTGTIAGLIGTMVVGAMLGEQPSHYPADDNERISRIPFVGWSTTSGDLRIAHFVGMHAMQGMLLLSVTLSMIRVRFQVGRFILLGVSLHWVALTLYLIHLATRDQSPFNSIGI